MHILNMVVGLLCAGTMLISAASSGEIQILLKSGGDLNADLVSVRDSALVICRVLNVSERVLQANPSLVEVLPLRNIDLVKVEGHSYVAPGLAIGGLGGALVGGLIGSQVKDETKENVGTLIFAPVEHTAHTAAGALIGMCAGFVLGAMIGNATSSPDEIIDPHVTGWTIKLRRCARYPGKEPEFLTHGFHPLNVPGLVLGD